MQSKKLTFDFEVLNTVYGQKYVYLTFYFILFLFFATAPLKSKHFAQGEF